MSVCRVDCIRACLFARTYAGPFVRLFVSVSLFVWLFGRGVGVLECLLVFDISFCCFWLYVWLSVCSSVCLFDGVFVGVFVFFCLFVCRSACLPLWLSVCLHVYTCTYMQMGLAPPMLS